jgi:hypothetical protein
VWVSKVRVCGGPFPSVRVSDSGYAGVQDRVCGGSDSGFAGVQVQTYGCPSPVVRGSDSGCVGVEVRVFGCPSPGVWVSDSGCTGVQVRVCGGSYSGFAGVQVRVCGGLIPVVRGFQELLDEHLWGSSEDMNDAALVGNCYLPCSTNFCHTICTAF